MVVSKDRLEDGQGMSVDEEGIWKMGGRKWEVEGRTLGRCKVDDIANSQSGNRDGLRLPI